jgi:DMSO/TMAO reductase YedYZ heme-binding membrane subunit
MNTLLWYVARSSGLVAWALLAASVLLGVTTAAHLGRRPSPAWQASMHRYLGGLATIFVGVHVLGVIADSYIHFSPLSALVPFASSWRPLATAYGIVGFWLLLAVELTSLARNKLPRRVWRGVHLASYPLFMLSTVHLLTAGTDAWTRPVRFAAGGTTMLIAVLTIVAIAKLAFPQQPALRTAPVRAQPRREDRPAAAASRSR